MKTMGNPATDGGLVPSTGTVGSQPASKEDLRPQRQQQSFEDCLRFLTSKGNLRFPKRSEETGTLCKERANERAASRSRSQAASEA